MRQLYSEERNMLMFHVSWTGPKSVTVVYPGHIHRFLFV